MSHLTNLLRIRQPVLAQQWFHQVIARRTADNRSSGRRALQPRMRGNRFFAYLPVVA
ncbi:MAG TPA: hypothetical protein VK986_19240 [Tepidisphaeraceae bacterium]|nr:hypothetical protein [Tepidisphaeraceae bacterium]